MWTMTNATSLQYHFKIRLEKETPRFTYKLAFHHLITTIVLHEWHKMAMALSTQLTSVFSHPVYPSLPGESLPLLADILFTVRLSAAAPEWRVWFFCSPHGILSQSQYCSCIPQEWVTTRARGKELHLSVYSLARLVHNVKTNKRIEQSVTRLLLCGDNQRKRETHPQRWVGQWQEMEHNTLAELVITC